MTYFDFVCKNDKPIAMFDYSDFFESHKDYGYLYRGKINIFIGEQMTVDDIIELFNDSIKSILI